MKAGPIKDPRSCEFASERGAVQVPRPGEVTLLRDRKIHKNVSGRDVHLNACLAKAMRDGGSRHECAC